MHFPPVLCVLEGWRRFCRSLASAEDILVSPSPGAWGEGRERGSQTWGKATCCGVPLCARGALPVMQLCPVAGGAPCSAKPRWPQRPSVGLLPSPCWGSRGSGDRHCQQPRLVRERPSSARMSPAATNFRLERAEDKRNAPELTCLRSLVLSDTDVCYRNRIIFMNSLKEKKKVKLDLSLIKRETPSWRWRCRVSVLYAGLVSNYYHNSPLTLLQIGP